ncbi:MAG: PqqD family protein [Myxococcales bacterium]|nr:PqqD family protein [Myxococcales bacterium]
MIAPDSRLTRSSRVASRVVGDRAVVVLIDTRELHTLNEVGTFVWEAFGSSRAVADVVADVAREFEVTPETAEGDVLRFIVRMMALGALQLVEEAP